MFESESELSMLDEMWYGEMDECPTTAMMGHTTHYRQRQLVQSLCVMMSQQILFVIGLARGRERILCDTQSLDAPPRLLQVG